MGTSHMHGRAPLAVVAMVATVAAGLGAVGTVSVIRQRSATPETKAASTSDLLAGQPLRFEENKGQFDPEVRFMVRARGYNLFLTPTEAVVVATPSAAPGKAGEAEAPAVVRMALAGGDPSARVEGEDRLGGASNYFIGNDPARWRTGVPSFGGVRYRAVYPGVDLVFRDVSGSLEYDFEVAPGVDPAVIGLQMTGAEPTIDEGGGLVLKAGDAVLRQSKPVLFQGAGAARREVSGGFKLGAEGRVGYSVGPYDRSRTLVIDPVMTYSTFVGSGDFPKVTTDGSGNAYLTGTTSGTFPTAGSGVDTVKGGSIDRFVTKLDTTAPSGSALVWSTYLGGTGSEEEEGSFARGAVAVDASGNVFVTGSTKATDFPTTLNAADTTCGTDGACNGVDTNHTGGVSTLNSTTYTTTTTPFNARTVGMGISGTNIPAGTTIVSLQSAKTVTLSAPATASGSGLTFTIAKNNPFSDVFLTRLGSSGSLTYSTYLGGSSNEGAAGVTVGPAGAYVAGYSTSTNLPTTANAFDTTWGGSQDSFLAIVDTAAGVDTMSYLTYIGGTTGDIPSGLAVTPTGMVYLSGSTQGGGFPVSAGAYQPSIGGGSDAFVARLDPTAGPAGLVATYLGGNASENAPDGGNGGALALDAAGNVYMTGSTASTNYPVVGAYDSTLDGPHDAFVARMSPGLTALTYSTLLGATNTNLEQGAGIAVDGAGRITVVGGSDAANFPQVRAVQALAGTFTTKQFVAQLDPAAGVNGLLYSTFLGELGSIITGLALGDGAAGTVYVTGTSEGGEYPVTAGAYDETPDVAGKYVFLTKLDPAVDTAVISDLSVRGGPTTGGTTVVITGQRFTGGPAVTGVKFGTVPAASFLVNSATQITAVSPACLGCGQAVVTVSTANGASTGFRFVYGEGAFGAGGNAVGNGGSPCIGECLGALFTLPAGTILSLGPEGERAQVYNPATNSWSFNATCPINCGADNFAATSLVDGRVLITGGRQTGTLAGRYAFIYNPAGQGSFTATGSMTQSREYHSATLLSNGKVLVAGGCTAGTGCQATLSSAELFDPATGVWTATGSFSVPAGSPSPARYQHRATAVTGPACSGGTPPSWCNRVLVTGGNIDTNNFFQPVPVKTAQLYNPTTGTWSAVPDMSSARYAHTSTSLNGPACAGASPPSWCGRVLVTGGQTSGSATSEVYDPATASWGSLAAMPVYSRTDHAAVQLPSGKVVVAGGGATVDILSANLHRAEIYDPTGAAWSSAGALSGDPYPSSFQDAILLPSGPTTVCADRCGKMLVISNFGPATNLYTPRPVVTSISPSSGTGGTTVTLTGTGLTSVTSVSFGGVAGTGLAHNATNPDTSLTVVTPSGPAGAVTAVATSVGGASASTGPQFTYPGGQLTAGTFTAVTPARILDTRFATGTCTPSPCAAVAAGIPVEVQVTGQGGIPATGVSAVVMSVAVTGPTNDGFLRVWPSDSAEPNASNLNYTAGQTVPNLVTVKLSPTGRVTISHNSSGTTQVIVDVAGYYGDGTGAAGSRFNAVTPARVLDTRFATGTCAPSPCAAVAAAAPIELQVTGQGGIPATGVTAVVMSVAVTGPTDDGFLRVWPSDAAEPNASNLNYVAGQTVPNLVTVKLSPTGTVKISHNSAGSTQVIADVAGWYGAAGATAGSRFIPLTPARVLDTRPAPDTIGVCTPSPCSAVAAGTPVAVQITGQGGVPTSGVSAVVMSVAVTGPTTAGFLRVWPSDAAEPNASNLNYAAGQTVPNLVAVKLSATGRVTVSHNESGSTQVIADVAGWFNDGST